MKAQEKENALEWAISKLGTVEDKESVKRIVAWTTPRIRGSNERKWRLWDAEKVALERINQ